MKGKNGSCSSGFKWLAARASPLVGLEIMPGYQNGVKTISWRLCMWWCMLDQTRSRTF